MTRLRVALSPILLIASKQLLTGTDDTYKGQLATSINFAAITGSS